jgi:hypothetical protein
MPAIVALMQSSFAVPATKVSALENFPLKIYFYLHLVRLGSEIAV